MKQPPKRKHALLAFLPAAVVIGIVAATAAGISMVSNAGASTITVTGTVDATLDIPAAADPSNTGAGGTCTASGNDASFAIANGWESAATRTGACLINFGSSTGAIQLTMENGNSGGPFYCLHQPASARDCTGSNAVSNVGAGAAITANTFGIALESTPTNAVAGSTVTEDGNNDATTAESDWFPIPASGAPAELCQTSGPGTGSCGFRLGLRGRGAAPAQTAGHYDGSLVLTAAEL